MVTQDTGRKSDYRVEVDTTNAWDWHALLKNFDDAVIHQTWAYGDAVWGERNLSHLVLRRDQKIVAAAQVALSRLPAIGAGIAHIKFGPVWRLRDATSDPEVCPRLLNALEQEYCVRRGLVLRIKPWTSPDAIGYEGINEHTGFRYRSDLPHYETLVIDLQHDLKTLHAGLKPKWRYHLRRAEQQDYEILQLSGMQAQDEFLRLYRQMSKRKDFFDSSEITALPAMCAELPAELQPEFLFCRFRGEYVAGLALSCIGRTGFYLFGATGDAALKHRLSYPLHWHAVQWMKQKRCRWYDLAGISQPGVHQFKAGLAGRCGHEIGMGDYDSCRNPVSRLVTELGTKMRNAYRATRIRLSRR